MDQLLSDQSALSEVRRHTPGGVPVEGQTGGALGRLRRVGGGSPGWSGIASSLIDVTAGESMLAGTARVAGIERRVEPSERFTVALR
jgi:hypothetical protein